MSGELTPCPYHEGYESVTNPSQRAYADQLTAYAEALPGDHFFGIRDQDRFLGYYSSPYLQASQEVAAEQGVPPLFHEDIFQPPIASSVDEFIKVANAGASVAAYYKHYEEPQHRRGYYDRGESQSWERSFIHYKRQRYLFHAAFMQSIVNEGEPDQQALVAFLQNVKPVPLPGLYGERPDHSAEMYNKTEWLTASLLSALTLPPDKCSAGMKRRAIELYAGLADDEQLQQPAFMLLTNGRKIVDLCACPGQCG